MRSDRSSLLILALALGSCRAAASPGPVQREREWVSIGAGTLDRDASGQDVLDDGFGYTLQGGLVFSRGRLRPSIELGYAYSNHDVEPAPPGDDDLDIHRFLGGARLEYDHELLLMTSWVQAGIFYRWTDDSDFNLEPFDQDDNGVYVGGGLLFWFDRRSAIGPFVTHYVGEDDDLEETHVGFQALLRHSGSLGRHRVGY